MNAEYMVQMWKDSTECRRIGRYEMTATSQSEPFKLYFLLKRIATQARRHPKLPCGNLPDENMPPPLTSYYD